MSDATLTTTTPAGASPTRPVPPSWASVAPLLERWRIALLPCAAEAWVVVSQFGTIRGGARPEATQVPFAQLPQAIWEVSKRCEADAEAREGEACP